MERKQEQRLLQQAQRGIPDAFAALYQANVQAIYRYIVRRVDDTHLAEDLTADVFTKALQGLEQYQDRGRPFVAWLYRIAHARVVDHYRRTDRRGTEAELDDMTLASDSIDVDHHLDQQQVARRVRQAINSLTQEQQQVIELRFMEGYPIETAAQIMGKKPNAIKALQFRALRSLARKLEQAGLDMDAVVVSKP